MSSPPVKRSITAVLLCLFCFLGLASLPAPAAADYYDITAYIDSLSYLIIQDDTVQWHNANGWPPGTFGNSNDPTTISTSTPATITWYPTWVDWPNANNEYIGEFYSIVYTGLTPALPQTALSISLTQEQGRGEISIFQSPTADNAYTLILAFNDGPFEAAAWYEARVDFAPVPIPGTLLFLGSGLLALPWLQRRLNRG